MSVQSQNAQFCLVMVLAAVSWSAGVPATSFIPFRSGNVWSATVSHRILTGGTGASVDVLRKMFSPSQPEYNIQQSKAFGQL